MNAARNAPHVVLHCNAGHAYGMGHLMRCLTLAETANQRGWGVTIVGDLDDTARERAGDMVPAARLLTLPRERHLDELPAAVTSLAPDLVHLDSYWPESDAMAAAAPLLSNMQDGTFGLRDADLGIDANLSAERTFAVPSRSRHHLAGGSAALVRRRVTELRGVWEPSASRDRVLVVLGGTDPHGLTPAVLAALVSIPRPLRITVVAPPAVRDAVVSTPAGAHEITVVDFLDDLPAAAAAHDLTISAAGTSVWDLACLGVPMALVCVTENQEAGYRAALDAGIAVGLVGPDGTGWEALAEHVTNLLADPGALSALVTAGMATIDGLGAWRVVSAWEALAAGTAGPTGTMLDARPATIDDARTLFDWRNDPTTRQHSRTSDELSWDGHIAWLTATLADPTRRLLVIMRDDQPVATARWDLRGDGEWEISVSVAPEHRGQGLAAPVVAAAERVIAPRAPVRLIATVHDDNPASLRLFTRMGYLPHRPRDADGFAEYAKLVLPLAPSASAPTP